MQKKRLSFKTKILLTFLLLSSSAVLFTGYFNYRTATDIVANQAIRMNEQNVAKSAQAFDEKLKKILQSLNSIMFTEDFKQMLKDASAGKSDTYYAHMSRLQSMFTQIKFNERLIQSILITTPIGDFYSYSDQRKKTEFRDTELYERISQQHRAIWVESHEDQLFGDQTRVLSFVMELNVDGYTSDNYIVININEKGLKDFLYQSTDQPDEELLLVSSSGNLVIQSQSPYASMMNEPFISNTLAEPLNFEDQAFEVTLSDETYLINLTNLDTVKSWVLIGIQSKSELLHDVKRIQWTTIIIIFLCLIAMLILSRLLTTILTKPLLRLYKVMKNVEYRNDLSVRYEHGSNDDEFSQLGNRFNMMMDEIGQLIHGIEQAEAEKRKAEVMALTAQIDPHFFYNTLNTIYWKAELEKLDDVKNMILSFSRLFELGLNKGEELMTIEQEIEHVSQYLKLQKYCYEQKFDYDIEVDSRIDTSLLTLKLILQPLVENSILHGFKEIRRGGQIHVKLLRRNQQLQIQVADNGVGMDAEAIMEDIMSGPSKKRGYALRNVVHRLRLYYGDSVKVNIQSMLSKGTIVTIIIPYQEGQHDEK